MTLGFFSLLGLVFIVLKLTGVIAWSWFWVLLPVVLPVTLWVAWQAFIFLVFFLTLFFKS